MANRQYIGARYVPKFYENPNGGCEWEPGTAYEALTIVTFLNNSYTSRIPVPANAPAPNVNNNGYWVATGNYNAQVEEYREDVEKIKNDLETTNQNVSKNSDDISTLQSRNVISIGDSYGEQNSDSDIVNFYWVFLRSELNLVEGESFFHSNESGGGFINGSYLRQLNTLLSSMDSKTKLGVTDVIFEGGWNDSPYDYTEQMFTTAIVEVNEVIKKELPNAKVSVFFSAWGLRNNSQGSDLGQLFNAVQYYQRVGSVGWKYITNSEYVLHKYSGIWQSNGSHPNQGGQQRLGVYMSSGLLSGSVDVNEKSEALTYAVTGYGDSIGGEAPQFIECISNGIVSLNLYNSLAVMMKSGNYECDNNHPYPLLKINTNFMAGFGKSAIVNVMSYLQLTDNSLVEVPCSLYIDDRMRLCWAPFKVNGNAWYTVDNIKQVLLPAFKISVNTILA